MLQIILTDFAPTFSVADRVIVTEVQNVYCYMFLCISSIYFVTLLDVFVNIYG